MYLGTKNLPLVDKISQVKGLQVFEQALNKFRHFYLPSGGCEAQRLSESFGEALIYQAKTSHINPDIDEKIWAIWGNLEAEHKIKGSL